MIVMPLLTGLLLILPCLQDQPQVVHSRTVDVTFRFAQEELTGLGQRVLWVSVDGRRSWQVAKDAGVSVEDWKASGDESVRARVKFPGDGIYHLYGQFGDGVENLSPAPTAEGPHLAHVVYLQVQSGDETSPEVPGVVTKTPKDFELMRPVQGDVLVTGSRTVIEWQARSEEAYTAKSVTIYQRFGTGSWQPLFEQLELSGSQIWTVPAAGRGSLQLRLTALRSDGSEVSIESGPLERRGTPGLLPPVILEPRGGATWLAGRSMTVRWSAQEGSWAETGTELSYQIGAGGWVPITRGLSPTGFYQWAVPREATDSLRVRVRMKTTEGDFSETVSDPLTVEVRDRGDKRAAMTHYDRARVLHAQRHTAEAIAEYEKALVAWPDYVDALHELGRLYYEEREWARALEFFLRAGEAAPTSPEPYVNTAMAQMRLGLTVEAFSDLKDAVELGVDRNRRLAITCAEKLMELSVRFMATQRTDLAVEACQHILRIRHADPRVRSQARDFLEWVFAGMPEKKAK